MSLSEDECLKRFLRVLFPKSRGSLWLLLKICDEALPDSLVFLKSVDMEVLELGSDDIETVIGSSCKSCKSLSVEEEVSEALISRSVFVDLSDWEGMFVAFASILLAAS